VKNNNIPRRSFLGGMIAAAFAPLSLVEPTKVVRPRLTAVQRKVLIAEIRRQYRGTANDDWLVGRFPCMWINGRRTSVTPR